MDREIVYPGQVPTEYNILDTNKNAYISIAKLAAAIFGTSTLVNAFTCTQTSPASLTVNVGPGEIYSLQNIDNTAYSSLPPDTTHQILKQGINLNTTNLSCPALGTSGQSTNYLIEVGFLEQDTGSITLPYYNAAQPNVPYSGPNNSGQPNYETRQDTISLIAKAGTPATTGTQTTPSPDAGYVGIFVVTVAWNATTITNGNITLYPTAPFINNISTMGLYAADTGAVNAMVASVSSAITAYTTGLRIKVLVGHTSTSTTPTLNINSLGAVTIINSAGSAISVGDMVANQIADLIYNGTNFQLINPASSDTTYPSAANIQSNQYQFATTSGTNTYTASLSPALTTYTTGMIVYLKIGTTNTSTTCTINLNSLGAKNIKLLNTSSNPSIGDLVSGSVSILVYDGTQFELMNPYTLTTLALAASIQANSFLYAADSGLVNAYAMTLSPAITAYTTGMVVYTKITNTNTSTTCTLNINSLGTKTIKLTNGSSPNIGDLVAGQVAQFSYDGTNMQLLNPATLVFSSQIQSNSFRYAATSGTNTYTASLTPALTAYTTGMVVYLNIGATNTSTSPTINLNSLGAKNILLTNGAGVSNGDLQSGFIHEMVYDGTQFRLVNPYTIAMQSQIQANAYRYASTSGTNTYTASLSPAISGYTTGMVVYLNIGVTNTSTTCTINLNSLGAKTINNFNGTINNGDLNSGTIAQLVYDGTVFRLMNPYTLLVTGGATYATATAIQNSSLVSAVTSGTNTYTASLFPAPTSYSAGLFLVLVIGSSNTGASTLNLNSLGAQNIYQYNTATGLAVGDLHAGAIAILVYDGTNFRLINPYTYS